jgi:hypothetical protein
MRPVRVALNGANGVGATAPIPLDINQSPFAVSVAVAVSGGASLTYTVEHTYDDVFAADFSPSTAIWWSQTSLTTKNTSLEGNYTYPIRAVRLTLVSPTSSGTATMTVIQAGMPGR